MERIVVVLFVGAVLFCPGSLAQSRVEPQAEVKGIVTDIMDARVTNTTLVFEAESQAYRTGTDEYGRYSIRLKPGTYTVSVRPPEGLCRTRRAAFVAEAGAEIHFDFQLWVCPSDTFCCYNFTELEPAPHTQLKPLVLFGETRNEGELQVFTGAYFPTIKRYPVVLTFNLLTVRAEQLVYDRSKHLLMAKGDVLWQEGQKQGSGKNVQIRLDGLEPQIIP